MSKRVRRFGPSATDLVHVLESRVVHVLESRVVHVLESHVLPQNKVPS